jgi:hypothetical protein
MMFHLRTSGPLALLAALAGCGGAGPSAPIEGRRTASLPSSPVLRGATPAQRFSSGMGAPATGPSAGSDELIDYDLPEGWRALAPTNDRYVNLQPAGVAEAACYLSFLQGSAGGLEANVNRWRAQLGAPPLAAAEVAALPKHTLLGREATLVAASGTFTSMDGAPRAGFALLGLIVSEPDGSLFLKFTAPAEVVAAERARFLAFASSLRLARSHAHADEEPAPAPEGLRWTAPGGWSESAPRPMRAVTFVIEGGGECYVARLAGDAGGLAKNLDRWSQQMGGAGLSETELAALEQIPMLGRRVPLLALDGAFTGMDGEERGGHGLLGVAWIGAEQSFFVKLTGPSALVRAERDHFVAFVGSLEQVP